MRSVGKRDTETQATEEDEPSSVLGNAEVGDLENSVGQQVAEGLQSVAQLAVEGFALPRKSGDILHHDRSRHRFLGEAGDLENEFVARVFLVLVFGGEAREPLTRWATGQKVYPVGLGVSQQRGAGYGGNV